VKHIRVVNLDRFQHYKTRRPPWVKLYRRILEDPDWESLSDGAFRLAIALLLLASELENRIPYRLSWIKKRAGIATRKSTIRALLDEVKSAGFVEVVDDSEDQRKHSATPEKETDRNTTYSSGQRGKVGRVLMLWENVTRKPPPPAAVARWIKDIGEEELHRRLDSCERRGLIAGKPWTYVAKVIQDDGASSRRQGPMTAGEIQSALELEEEAPFDPGASG
jgi:hypothetical protein